MISMSVLCRIDVILISALVPNPLFWYCFFSAGIFPAVLALGGRTIENFSTTRVMRYITDKTIRKPRVFFALIGDFFCSIFILIGYRLKIEFILNFQNVDGPIYSENNFLTISTNGIAGYLLLKEVMTILSLYLTSNTLATRYFKTVFNLIDIASVAMLLGSSNSLKSDALSLEKAEGFAASFTIILLWLRLMGAFKILNSSFSLFLYAVVEVVKDIKVGCHMGLYVLIFLCFYVLIFRSFPFINPTSIRHRFSVVPILRVCSNVYV